MPEVIINKLLGFQLLKLRLSYTSLTALESIPTPLLQLEDYFSNFLNNNINYLMN